MSIKIRPIKKTDSARAFRDFIYELIDENAYLLINKKPTMKEEKEWLREKQNNIKKKKEVCLIAWDGKKAIGVCDAKKDRWKKEQNILIGIAVLKAYRGKGLGEKLLRSIIKLAKRKLKPINIYLSVFAENKVAWNLYRKIGFRQIARFPKWIKHNGRQIDEIYMILK